MFVFNDNDLKQPSLALVMRLAMSKGSQGTESVAQLIDGLFYPGIFEEWARAYVAEIRPLLQEVLPLNAERLAILADPKKFFGARTAEEARDRTVAYFFETLNAGSPEHAKRAMMAHIELGLGDFFRAGTHAGFARNEADVPNFGEEIHGRTARAIESILAVELRKAELLVALASKRSSEKGRETHDAK